MVFKRNSEGKFRKRVVKKVWNSLPKDADYPDGSIKRDRYGRLIKFEDHGNRRKGTGWEIDHKIPRSRGGKDNYGNLEPLQWANNKRKSNRYTTK